MKAVKFCSSRLGRLPLVQSLSSQAGVGPVVSCDLEEVQVPSQSWPSLCWSQLGQFCRHTALVDGLTGRSYSLVQARELAARAGNGLLR